MKFLLPSQNDSTGVKTFALHEAGQTKYPAPGDILNISGSTELGVTLNSNRCGPKPSCQFKNIFLPSDHFIFIHSHRFCTLQPDMQEFHPFHIRFSGETSGTSKGPQGYPGQPYGHTQ